MGMAPSWAPGTVGERDPPLLAWCEPEALDLPLPVAATAPPHHMDG